MRLVYLCMYERRRNIDRFSCTQTEAGGRVYIQIWRIDEGGGGGCFLTFTSNKQRVQIYDIFFSIGFAK